MRVLIDACLPVQLKNHLPLFEVHTTREMGWHQKSNGDLLKLAQEQFDVLVSMDKGIPSQQDLTRYAIALLVIKARSNRLPDLLPLIPRIMECLPLAKRGKVLVVGE